MIPLKWLRFSGGATIKHGTLPANHTANPETIHRRVFGRHFMEFFYPQKRVMERQTWGGLTNKRIKIRVSTMRAESQQLVTCQTSGFNQQNKITVARNGDVIRSNAEPANKHAERGFQQ